ncbi:MAG: hypothetical protein K1X92_03695 [Bacteroidia bacterium]|nr:hypothetical protein [Bacteroidia bacterium]
MNQKLIFTLFTIISILFITSCGQKERILPERAYSSKEGECSGIFRTQTQGGWGTKASGNNPGKYLASNFTSVFPSGLVIGCKDGNSLTLTSAENIRKFLPQGGTAKALSTSYVNPVDLNNVFAGQVVALNLNVSFDTNDFTFGNSQTSLGDQVVAYGTFAGISVNEILTEANNVLGGCGTMGYSISEMNEVVSRINENYVNGNTNLEFLICP